MILMVKTIKFNLPSTFDQKITANGGLDVKIGSTIYSQGYKSGSSTFVGSGGTRTIAHGIGSTPSFVHVIPSTNPDGYLGEMWVSFDATNIYVGNTGSFTGAFTYIIFK